MLESTFIHAPGIARPVEIALWTAGCRTWGDFLASPERWPIGNADRNEVVKAIERSQNALACLDPRAFAHSLGVVESWRAFPQFRSKIAYVDIETDGGSNGTSITMIGVFDGTEFRCFVKDQNLADFPAALAECAMIVTFYGSAFDLPMIRRLFHRMPLPQIHLDLCFALRKVGYRGGLKSIERQLGLDRSDDTTGLDGRDAIRLWHRHKFFGDERALETLIAYNREDVVNLEHLAEIAYDALLEQATIEALDSVSAAT